MKGGNLEDRMPVVELSSMKLWRIQKKSELKSLIELGVECWKQNFRQTWKDLGIGKLEERNKRDREAASSTPI